MYAMRIRYYHTLYKREATMNVFGDIKFEDGRAVFKSGGHGYAIEMEYIIRIEPIEE